MLWPSEWFRGTAVVRAYTRLITKRAVILMPLALPDHFNIAISTEPFQVWRGSPLMIALLG